MENFTPSSSTIIKHLDTGCLNMKVEPEDDDMLENSSVQLDSLCRMCARPCDTLAPSSPSLTYQLEKYFDINIDADDRLPRSVCNQCSDELSHWEQVRSSVEQAQTCLRQLRDTQAEERQQANETGDDVNNDVLVERNNEDENFEEIIVKVNPDMTDSYHVENEIYSCSTCNAEYRVLGKFIKHRASCREKVPEPGTSDDGMVVEASNNVTPGTSKLQRPHSPNNPYQCGVCPMKFKTQTNLSDHLDSHKNCMKSLPCPHCNMVFRTVKSIIRHLERHVRYPNKQITLFCEVCKKEFLGAKKLEGHMNVHVKRYQCSMCDDSFRHKSEFDEHVSKHRQGLISSKLKKGSITQILPPGVIPLKKDEVSIAPKVIKKVNQLMPTTSSVVLTNKGPVQYVYLPTIILNKDGSQPDTFQIQMAPNIILNQNNIASTSKESTHVQETESESIQSLPQTLRINVDDADYPCGFCHANFKDYLSFGEHMEIELEMNKEKKLPCGFCGAVFKKISSLTTHTEDHKVYPERATSYTCPICSHIFHRHSHFLAHSRTHQKDKLFKCTFCNAQLNSKVTLRNHIKKKHAIASKVYTTEHFSEPSTSSTEPALIRAVNNNDKKVKRVGSLTHRLNQLPPENKKKILEERKFRRVRKVEHYSCDYCNYKFFSPQFLYDHYLEKHIQKGDLICPICKKVKQLFGSHEELLKHLRTHAVIYKSFCPVCDRGFRQKAAMREHLPLHSHERNFQCEICSRRFRARGALFFHKKFVHEERKFMCEYCSMLFPIKHAVKKHILLKHTTTLTPDVFECQTCSKTFTTKDYLKKHEYTHKDTKPYRCINCNKGFIDPHFYRLHLKKVCKISDDDIVFFRQPFPQTQIHGTGDGTD